MNTAVARFEPVSETPFDGLAAQRRAAFRSGVALVFKLPEIIRRRRELRALFDARAELAYDLLADRVSLTKLKGAAAEPYLQGLDVLEIRGERLLEVLAIRAGRTKRCPWRQSPYERAERVQPNTAAGQRQTAWLLQLEDAGMLKAQE